MDKNYETNIEWLLDSHKMSFLQEKERQQVLGVINKLFADHSSKDISQIFEEDFESLDHKSIKNRNNWYKYFLHQVDNKDISYREFFDLINKGDRISRQIASYIKQGKRKRLLSLCSEVTPENLMQTKALLLIYAITLRSNQEYQYQLPKLKERLSAIARTSKNKDEVFFLFFDYLTKKIRGVEDIQLVINVLHNIAESSSTFQLSPETSEHLIIRSIDVRNATLKKKSTSKFQLVFWTFFVIDNMFQFLPDSVNKKRYVRENQEFIKKHILSGNITNFIEYSIIRDTWNGLFKISAWPLTLFGGHHELDKFLYQPSDLRKVEAKVFLDAMSIYDYNPNSAIPFKFEHLSFPAWKATPVSKSSEHIKFILLKCIDLEIKTTLLGELHMIGHPWGFKPNIPSDENVFEISTFIDTSMEQFMSDFADATMKILTVRIPRDLQITLDLDNRYFEIIDPKDGAKLVEVLLALPNKSIE